MKKTKLIIDGNAFYEIDLECQRKKEMEDKEKLKKKEKPVKVKKGTA